MIVRNASLADLNRCLPIDGSYTTEHVWQMYIEEKETETRNISFRTMRLPRPMNVSYPREPEYLVGNWQKGDCFLVAEDAGQIVGYLDMTVEAWHKSGWINNLVVAKERRRQGIGTTLLRAAMRWAEARSVRTIMLETQTKNYPAMSFYQKHGFVFSGFNDHYYTNQDIALFFAYELR
jgi:ribosomal protein S18 acetylase RimI-like enzyme